LVRTNTTRRADTLRSWRSRPHSNVLLITSRRSQSAAVCNGSFTHPIRAAPDRRAEI
jgi:hypothetical protein